jgi:hypothetical protein
VHVRHEDVPGVALGEEQHTHCAPCQNEK